MKRQQGEPRGRFYGLLSLSLPFRHLLLCLLLSSEEFPNICTDSLGEFFFSFLLNLFVCLFSDREYKGLVCFGFNLNVIECIPG